jgi:hypothetical protein
MKCEQDLARYRRAAAPIASEVGGRPREIMKLMMNAVAMIAGVLMILPKVLPWVCRLTEKSRHSYNPDAHTDFIVVAGSRSVSTNQLLAILAFAGVVLILMGAFGVWRTMK